MVSGLTSSNAVTVRSRLVTVNAGVVSWSVRRQVFADIMQNGSERTLAPGESLPSECELTAVLQVSRQSVREACGNCRQSARSS